MADKKLILSIRDKLERKFGFVNFLILLFLLLFSISLSLLGTSRRTQYPTDYSPIFGVTYHTELRFNYQDKGFDREAIMADLNAIRTLGVDLIRTDVCWQRVPIESESALGFDTWLIGKIHSMGIKVMLVIKTPEQIKLYSPILAKAEYWQVGNEPNSLAFAQAAGNHNYEETLEYLVKNINLLRTLSPNITTVINPVDVPRIQGVYSSSWLDIYADLNKRGVNIPIIGIDSYPGGPYQWGYPSETGQSIRITRENSRMKGLGSTPIWIIETGSPTYRRSLDSQSRFIREAIVSAVSAGAEGIVLYEAFDNSRVSSELTAYLKETTAIESNFGLFYENRIPKPAAREYQIIISEVRRKEILEEPITGFVYAILSGVLRLFMPTGGPLVLSELAGNPNMVYSGIGLAFRYFLGRVSSKRETETREKKEGMFTDLFLALIILSTIIIFQLITNTIVLLWYIWLGYVILFSLYLWCGMAQIRSISEFSQTRKEMIGNVRFLLPSIIGFLISLAFDLPLYGWFFFILAETFCIIAILRRQDVKRD